MGVCRITNEVSADIMRSEYIYIYEENDVAILLCALKVQEKCIRDLCEQFPGLSEMTFTEEVLVGLEKTYEGWQL